MSEIHVYGFCEDKCRREVMLKADLDAKFSAIDTSINGIKDGTIKTKNAENADSAASADNATKLATARKINGVAFDGTQDITIEDDTKAPANHNHDSRYYTETEVDNLLAEKANADHNHDSRYYTETEVDGLLAEKAAVNHNHGSMSTITFAAEEPTSVAVGEIVMVYET